MDAAYSYSFSGNPYQQRMPLLLREILFALLSEAKDASHPLVEHFGYDEKMFNFLRNCTSHSILRLSSSYIRANAFQFTINNRLLKVLLKESVGDYSASDISISSGFDSIYGHNSVVKELVMIMSDSLLFDQSKPLTASKSNGLIDIDVETRRMLFNLDASSVIKLAHSMVKHRCVQFAFDKIKIRDRTISHMVYEKRESIKDLMVIKRATVGLMMRVFSEETDDSHAARRFRLGFTATGRPRTCSESVFNNFVMFWVSNQDKTELDRFLEAHRRFGCSFDQLWTMFQRAASNGEFDKEVIENFIKTKNRIDKSLRMNS